MRAGVSLSRNRLVLTVLDMFLDKPNVQVVHNLRGDERELFANHIHHQWFCSIYVDFITGIKTTSTNVYTHGAPEKLVLRNPGCPDMVPESLFRYSIFPYCPSPYSARNPRTMLCPGPGRVRDIFGTSTGHCPWPVQMKLFWTNFQEHSQLSMQGQMK